MFPVNSLSMSLGDFELSTRQDNVERLVIDGVDDLEDYYSGTPSRFPAPFHCSFLNP
jgi:hypothetical protein